MTDLEVSASTSLPTSTHSLTPDATGTPHIVNIGTRKSQLARIQTDIVVDALKKSWPETQCRVHAISTMGDKNQKTALHEFGAKNLWTFELEAMLRQGDIDFIVHSLKDIPTQLSPDFTIGSVMAREDPRDALVLHPSLPSSATLSSLPPCSTIGTSSVRRSAQLKRLHPHLRFQSVRGNVNTRLRKLDESDLSESRDTGSKAGEIGTVEEDATGKPQYSGLILAAAGLIRMGEGHRISRNLSSKNMEQVRGSDGIMAERKGMLHAVGQGALGIEIREGDRRVVDLLAPLECRRTRLAAMAERSLMRTLEGGCSVPIGVETEWADLSAADTSVDSKASAIISGGLLESHDRAAVPSDSLTFRAIVVSLDGLQSVEEQVTRQVRSNEEADQFGRDVARALIDKGAEKILEKINLDRSIINRQDDA